MKSCPHLKSDSYEDIKNELVKKDYKVAIEKVDYEFQKGGNEIISRKVWCIS
ncbi:MAG: hypothetical protein K8R25_03505 [Methanosarcinales archaeon]|nr:hypothetical protein [Methanosarcinales archaeon]